VQARPVAWPPSLSDLTPMDFFLWFNFNSFHSVVLMITCLFYFFRQTQPLCSYGATFTHHHLILKRVLLPVSLRQQQTYTLESHISLSCVSRSVAVCLDIALNLYEMQLFFIIPHWFCLISNMSQTSFDGMLRCKDVCLVYGCSTINV